MTRCDHMGGFLGMLVVHFPDVELRETYLGFGVIQGEDKKKFKTRYVQHTFICATGCPYMQRSGETVKLSDLLDEALCDWGEFGRCQMLCQAVQRASQDSLRNTLAHLTPDHKIFRVSAYSPLSRRSSKESKTRARMVGKPSLPTQRTE